tara:strand:+ start:20333 stop:21181 length:849 start_codon:yes stop_codon:yes gene_type:complete
MKIAMLISGRAARYEVCLLPILKQTNYHDIDLFMSVNDENDDCPYYNKMKIDLKPWLKGCVIKKFIIPEHFFNIFDKTKNTSTNQFINNKWVPYNVLSMLYNDNNSYNLAIEYSKKNSVNYDIFMKFRSDIMECTIPKELSYTNNLHLYSVVPLCNFQCWILGKKELGLTWIISDAWVWGNEDTMKIYCNAYDYVLNTYIERNGYYNIHFESCVTDNIINSTIPYSYCKYEYHLDRNRRIFDLVWDGGINNCCDERMNNIPNCLNPQSSKYFNSNIKATRHE